MISLSLLSEMATNEEHYLEDEFSRQLRNREETATRSLLKRKKQERKRKREWFSWNIRTYVWGLCLRTLVFTLSHDACLVVHPASKGTPRRSCSTTPLAAPPQVLAINCRTSKCINKSMSGCTSSMLGLFQPTSPWLNLFCKVFLVIT